MLCRFCQSQNPPGVRVCQQCGQPLWTTQELQAFQQTRAAIAARMKETLPPKALRVGRRGPFSLLFALSSGCLARVLGTMLIVGLTLSFSLFGGALFGRAPVAQLSGPNSVVDVVAWSPDGTRIAAGSEDQTVRIWDVHSGQQLLVHQGYTIGSVGEKTLAWSPDSKRIASIDHDQNVQIWDAATGQVQRTFHQFRQPRWLAWSPDGTSLAIDGPDLGMVQILDVQSGKTQESSHLASDLGVAAWSPDGKWLALGTYASTVLLWRADGPSAPRVYTGHRFAVHSLAWSPDGKRIVSVGSDTRGVANASPGVDEIQVWDVTTLHLVYAYSTTLISDLTVRAISWSPDGKRIAMSTNNYSFQFWDADTGHHLQTYGTPDEEISTLAWSPDSTRIAEAGLNKTISIYTPHATFIGQASLYDLIILGVFAAMFMLLFLLLGLTGRRLPGRTRSVLLWILLICVLTAVLMALMITIGLNPLFWDPNA